MKALLILKKFSLNFIVKILCWQFVLAGLFLNSSKINSYAQTPTPVPAGITLTVIGLPETAKLAGFNKGNIPNFEVAFNLDEIPKNALILTATLHYLQTGVSNDYIKIINKYSSTVIDSKSLAQEGPKSFNSLIDIVQDWVKLPSSNQGLLLQSNNLGLGNTEHANDLVNFSEINMSIYYTIPDTSVPVISDVQIKDVTKNSAAISFSADEPVTGKLNYGKTSAYSSSLEFNSPATFQQVILTGLIDGLTYHLQISALDSAGNKSISQDFQFVTLLDNQNILGENLTVVSPELLNPPKNLLLELASDSEQFYANISWTGSETYNIDGYVVYRSADNRDSFQQYKIVERSVTKLADFQTEPGYTYFYFVRAYKGNQLSEKSNESAIFIQDKNAAVGGASAWENSQPQQVFLVLLAFIGLILVIYYVVFKVMEKLLSRKSSEKKRSLKNVLRDPDFYL
ncbi:MAG TPA: fibronectin type III domain-containing protein [Candidatus Dojkabacteria bacterium]|nr:fibronectin type III domain-containing protein [Candidatus Dojkabacteria bacterium]